MTAETVAKRHPIRALLWGLLIGIGVAIYLTLVFPVIVLDSVSAAVLKMAIVALGVAVIMMVVTMYVIPPKKPKGPAPGRAAPGSSTTADETVPTADTEPEGSTAPSEATDPGDESASGSGDGGTGYPA